MWRMRDDRLFTLEVCIVSGPMTEEFVKRNRVIARTIKIRGDQTLEELHDAIFVAFGREDGHMYEFQIGGKGPNDPKSERYVLPTAMEVPIHGARSPAGDVTHAAVGALGLETGEAFGYWFDFGDDWQHQIKVIAIEPKAPRGRFPRVTQRVGADPPQYADFEEAS